MEQDEQSSDSHSELTIVFEKSQQKNTIPATGAAGGPTPDGAAVVAHLFVEHGSVPNYVTHDVNREGRVKSQGKPVQRGEITREVQSTLVMSPENAHQLGEWLVRNSKQAMQNRSNSYE